MKIHFTPRLKQGVEFAGAIVSKVDNAIGKLIEPKPVLSENAKLLLNQVEDIAKKGYNPLETSPLNLSVKNGNKEFSFIFNNSAWHRVRLTKKSEILSDFEILHVKGDDSYDYYSTGGYPSKIIDKKYIKQYNELLEEWMPRLIKRCNQLEKRK